MGHFSSKRTRRGDRYWAMLNEFLFTKIKEENISNIWFQQNRATCHTAEAALGVLSPVFEDLIIRAEPASSCNLTPLDYYLWGAVEDKCYADKPEIIDTLKDNIGSWFFWTLPLGCLGFVSIS